VNPTCSEPDVIKLTYSPKSVGKVWNGGKREEGRRGGWKDGWMDGFSVSCEDT